MSDNESQNTQAEQTESVVAGLLDGLADFAKAYVVPDVSGLKMADATRQYIEADNMRHQVVNDAAEHFISKQAESELRAADKSAYWPRRLAEAIMAGDAWEKVLGRKIGAADVLMTIQSVVGQIKRLETIVNQGETNVLLAVYLPVFTARLNAAIKGFKTHLATVKKSHNIDAFEDLRSTLGRTIRQARKIMQGEPADKEISLTLQAMGVTAQTNAVVSPGA